METNASASPKILNLNAEALRGVRNNGLKENLSRVQNEITRAENQLADYKRSYNTVFNTLQGHLGQKAAIEKEMVDDSNIEATIAHLQGLVNSGRYLDVRVLDSGTVVAITPPITITKS